MTPQPPGQDGRKLRVLIVEDYADAATSLATLLTYYGCETGVAGDGPAAVAAARACPPDVVLLDIGLPGMDGYELAPLLRDGRVPGAPVIIAVSGFVETDRRRALEAGIVLHLLKPVDPEQLRRLLGRFGRVTTPMMPAAERVTAGEGAEYGLTALSDLARAAFRSSHAEALRERARRARERSNRALAAAQACLNGSREQLAESIVYCRALADLLRRLGALA